MTQRSRFRIALHNERVGGGHSGLNRARITSRPAARTDRPRGNAPILEGEMQILLIAFCTLAAIWLVVLWGSRYLGPQ
jgi:cell division septal protein FtsQ